MKNITIEQGHALRKKGYYLITDNNMINVIDITTNKHKANKISKRQNCKVWAPLVKIEWTAEDTKKAIQELSLGLQCGRINLK